MNKTTNAVAKDQSPFIRVREVVSSCPWGGWIKERMPEDLRRKFFFPFWPEARLRRHLEMLQAFGFNSIQISIPTQALWVNARLQDWGVRQLFIARTARELGLSVSQFVWGGTVADPNLGGQGLVELDWRQPADRARLEAWYREQTAIAPYLDRVITHWIDPGQPQGGLDMVIEQHNVILALYRAQNPKIRGALSTWFMKPGNPPGYTDPGQLAAKTALDRETDVAIGLMNYGADGVNLDFAGELKAADLVAIAATGRQAGVWSWYTTDNEIQPALHVRTDVLQNYFRSLPSQTRTTLAWHSVEDNFAGLNMPNLYVAGKLMQDPALDARQLLQEFVRGMFGEDSVPTVTAALRAVEQARTRSLWYQAKALDAVAPADPAQKNRQPLPATWLDETTAAVDAALRGLPTLKLAPDFQPAWPVTISPEDYLVELQAHLTAIRQMLAFLKGAREIERLKAAGAPVAKLETAINALPKVTYDLAHTAGLEAAVYPQKLAALRKSTCG